MFTAQITKGSPVLTWTKTGLSLGTYGDVCEAPAADSMHSLLLVWEGPCATDRQIHLCAIPNGAALPSDSPADLQLYAGCCPPRPPAPQACTL